MPRYRKLIIVLHLKQSFENTSQNIVDKIFHSLFTTKPTKQGTRLRLSLALELVKAHRGELKVETKEGNGTTFIIQLLFLENL